MASGPINMTKSGTLISHCYAETVTPIMDLTVRYERLLSTNPLKTIDIATYIFGSCFTNIPRQNSAMTQRKLQLEFPQCFVPDMYLARIKIKRDHFSACKRC